jgi:signal transduction histidine kinase
MGVVASRIARGDLSARSGITRRDELGDLGRHIDGMADSLEKAEEMKKRLIADAAHELRTPVTLIRGTLEMILDGVYDPGRERLEKLYGETELMSRLIGDLQALAGWEAGNMVLEKQEFSLSALGRDAADSFGGRWNQEKAEVLFSGSGEFMITADPLRIKQVFLNLYSNALRHLPPAGRLETSFIEKTDEIVVTVTNNGPPLPAGMEEKVFDRFVRVDSSRNREYGGRGLGLSIAREIVLAHGGRIWAENLPGGAGVRFAFSLPR